MTKARWLAVLCIAVACLVGFARADDYDGSGDGPQPDVARVSLIHGDVSMQRGDSGDWTQATLNTPLVRGDQISTGERSRTEVQLDYANILRLSSRSQAKIADLTRTHIQIQVAEGYANYSVFKGSEADVEIDTPNVAVRPLKRGRYRIQVNSASETEVIVRDGEAEVSTPQGSTSVKEGQRMIVRGTESPEYRVDSAPGKDEWDRWNKDRDNVIRDAQSWHRTNAYYTGAHDLDAYGHWVFVPGYGWVWQPYDQGASWAPYRDGRWVWEPYYGWTWVSYEPWGWAPYHYGRWFFWSGSWVWWPGPVYAHYRPIWAPAYVTFIGFGSHSSFAFGFGSIGWLPVGPAEPCYPWWGRGFNRVNVVNITNITNVTNITNINNVNNVRYSGRGPVIPPLGDHDGHDGHGRHGRGEGSNVHMALTNLRVRSAIPGVPSENFGRGNVRVRALGVHEGDLRESRVMTGNLPVVPTRESLHAGGAIEGRPAGVQPRRDERFFTRRQPPAGPPAFRDQANRVQQVVRENVGNAEVPAIQNRGNNGQGQASGEFRGQPGMTNRNGGPERNGRVNNPVGGPSVAQFPGRSSQPGEAGNGRVAVPARTDQGTNAGQNDGWHGFGGGRTRPVVNSQDGASGAGSRTEGPSQQTGGSNAPESRDRGGWSKFGSPQGRAGNNPAQHEPTAPAGRGNTRVPGNDRATGSSGAPAGTDRGGFRRFPSGGDRAPQQPDRTSTPVDRGGAQDSGGFRRFPSGGDRAPQQSDRGRSSKPPLELNKPIVTPRSEPRMSPSPSAPRMEPPRGDRGSYGGGGNRGSFGGGNRGGSYDRGSSGNRGWSGGGGNRGGGSSAGGGNRGGGGSRGSNNSGGNRGGESGNNPKHR